MCSSKKYLLFVCILGVLLMNGSSTEFEVGESFTKGGWEVPPSKDPNVYNHWAQKNRFKVNDTLHFKYKKDSVMVVSDPEYDKCKSTQPVYFANNGDTTFVLDRPGPFYFISGVSGHCERGQKMIVKVLDVESPPHDHDDDHHSDGDAATNKINGAANNSKFLGCFWCFPSFLLLVVMGFFYDILV